MRGFRADTRGVPAEDPWYLWLLGFLVVAVIMSSHLLGVLL